MLPLAGPRIVLVAAVVELLLCGAVLQAPGSGEAELRAVVRLTAMVSLLCFLAAFTASALARRWPGPGTRWLVANRRWLGLAFAASHAGHALAIWQLVRRVPGIGAAIPMQTRVVGGLAYLVIVLLAATSNDAAARWLGPRRWRRLHAVGVHVVWFVFAATYVRGALSSPLHLVAVLALAAALLLRLTSPGART